MPPPALRALSVVCWTLLTTQASAVLGQSYEALPPGAGQLSFQPPDSFFVAGNVAVFDGDGDGDLDLLWTMGSMASVRFDRNVGSPGVLAFEEATAAVGLAAPSLAAMGFGLGDFDGDGRTDVYVGQPGPDRLFLATAAGTFIDVSETHLDGDEGLSAAAAVADFDGDGDLDIYVGRYVGVVRFPYHVGDSNRLLVNDGRGVFTDRAAEWGLDDPGSTLAAVWSDVDEDGDLDLLVINDFGPHTFPHRAFRNDGPGPGDAWVFSDVGAAWGFDRGLYGMGVGVLDADRDGHLDYYLTSIGRHVLLAGPPGPSLEERTDALGVAATFASDGHRSTWAMAVLDADADGYDDLYVRSGQIGAARVIQTGLTQRDRLWSLGPDGRLRDRWSELFPSYANRAGRGVVAADLDGAGPVEVLAAAVSDVTRIYFGGGNPDPVRVLLAATVSAPGAPGARLWLDCGGAPVNLRELHGGGALGSAGPPGRAWLPVPPACGESALLNVRWPTGASSVLAVTAGETVTVTEPEWFFLDPATLAAGSDETASLVVWPHGPDGLPLGPGHEVVAIVGPSRTEQPLDDVGDGTYRSTLAAPAEPGTVDVSVRIDGERPPVLRRLWIHGPPVPALTISPRHLVVDRPAVFTVDLGTDAVADLIVDGTDLDVEDLGPGRARVAYTLDAAGPVNVQLLSDGEPVGAARLLTVFPRLDPQRTWLEVDFPFASLALGATAVQITTVRALDINGASSRLTAPEVTLLENGAPLAATVQIVGGTRVRVVPSRALLPDRSMTLSLAGQSLSPIPIRGYASEAELIAVVAPDRTGMGTYFEGCRADGSDVLTATILPRTAEGHPLPLMASLTLEADGATLIDGSVTYSLGMYEVRLRCGTTPGQGRLALWLGGAPLGVERTFRLYPERTDPFDPAASFLRGPGGPVAYGTPAQVEVIVFDEQGDRYGSGLEVAASVADSDDWLDVPYCGVGVYCLDLYGPVGGDFVSVAATVDGEPIPESILVWFAPFAGGDDDGPDDGAEALDAGGADGDLDVASDGSASDAGLDADLGDAPTDLTDAESVDADDAGDPGAPDVESDTDDPEDAPVSFDGSDAPEQAERDELAEAAPAEPTSSGEGCACRSARPGEGLGWSWPLWVWGLVWGGVKGRGRGPGRAGTATPPARAATARASHACRRSSRSHPSGRSRR